MRPVGATSLLSCLLAALLTTSLVLGSRVHGISSQLKDNGYESLLMRDLYKRLAQLDDSGLDLSDIADLSDVTDDLAQEYADGKGPTVQEAVRDSELIEHSSSAAGNALEEALSASATNSDESLPFYCHPPNPCPKGVTSDCQTEVPDTAEAQKAWITTMQDAGYCACDREHMFDCPVVESLEGNVEKKKALDDRAEPAYLTGEKRQSLVAKKSPRIRRSLSRGVEHGTHEKKNKNAQKSSNPYLQGERLRTVAKKG